MATRTREERKSLGLDERFADTLRPLVENALTRSVRDEPQFWALAISPILGPAIRMAVTSALRDMVQTFNRLLENSLSLRSWRWRVEAWRTGKPFTEIVLLRTLVFRVEQVLLVDRNSGLLLASVAAPGLSTENSDLVSAMLTAIQDFVHDSFRLEQGDSVRQIHTGEFSLWVETGQFAALAAAVRGNAPVEFHEILRAAVDLIHEEMAPELRNFRGDSTPFEQRGRPILEGCLQSRFQDTAPRSYWKAWMCAAVVGAALLAWGGLKIHNARHWNGALAALRATPGITITEATVENGEHVLQGLRDPFAAPAESVLAKHGILQREVSLRLQPFLSLDPRLLIRRARAVIDAPSSVSASLDRGVLTLWGEASHQWIISAQNSAQKLAITGIDEIRTDGIEDKELEALRSETEAVRILFQIGSSAIATDQARLIQGVIPKLRQWITGVLTIDRVPSVKAVGHADSSGAETTNATLSNQRALHVMEFLVAGGIPPQYLTALGGRQYENRENAGAEAPDSAIRRNVELRLSSKPEAAGSERY
jgi:OOP family OmpA-OmpF porin